jgi:hypothetical protein
MGINAPFAEFLGNARQSCGPFEKVLTIGRQGMSVPAEILNSIARRLAVDNVAAADLALDIYSERLLSTLFGAREVLAIDYSDFEGVGIVHDLNAPIAESLWESFDTLIDGGAMEHIFDVRQVFQNYMRLVRIGGSIFIAAPANNQFGHGFYQFSSELFYRVFSPENGFELARCCLVETNLLTVELSATQRVYETIDPAIQGKRIYLCNSKPITILVHARKVASVTPLARPPLQSDYSALWQQHERCAVETSARRHEPFQFVGYWEELRRRRNQSRRRSLRNRRFFKPLTF